MRDGAAEYLSQDHFFRHGRGRKKCIPPVQFAASRVGNLKPLMPSLSNMMVNNYMRSGEVIPVVDPLSLLQKMFATSSSRLR